MLRAQTGKSAPLRTRLPDRISSISLGSGPELSYNHGFVHDASYSLEASQTPRITASYVLIWNVVAALRYTLVNALNALLRIVDTDKNQAYEEASSESSLYGSGCPVSRQRSLNGEVLARPEVFFRSPKNFATCGNRC
jgi:hypothetical protein